MIERSGSVFDRRPEPFVLLPLGSIENKSPPHPSRPSSLLSMLACYDPSFEWKVTSERLREEIIVPVENECKILAKVFHKLLQEINYTIGVTSFYHQFIFHKWSLLNFYVSLS